MALTQAELEAIRKRAEASTEGLIVNERDYYEHKTARLVTNGHVYVAKVFTGQADAEFIANARQDVPALLAEVERLQAELQARDDHDLIEAIEDAFGTRIEENAKVYADIIRKRFAEQEEFEWRNTTAKRK
jgi:hypothetical protein